MAATATRGFTIDSLNHVVLRVRDLDRSEVFYRDVLGLQVRRRPGPDGVLHLRDQRPRHRDHEHRA